MKMLSLVSISCALMMLVPSIGPARAANNIGLYADPSGEPYWSSVYAMIAVPFNVYLVVTDPVNEAYIDGAGTPPYRRVMTSVSGFESRVRFWDNAGNLLPGLFVLSTTYNGNAIRLGEGNEFVVGFAAPIPVAGVAALMVTFSVLVIDYNPKDIYLGLTSIPSLPDVLAIVDGSIETDNLQAAMPSSGRFDQPVLLINSFTATENESWGSLKALYR